MSSPHASSYAAPGVSQAVALQYPFPDLPEAGTVTAVAPGVYWLRMPLPFSLNHINLWLIEDGEQLAVVDTGIGNDSTRALWQQFFDSPLGKRGVSRVILTHHHPDHAGNAQWLAERFGVSVWMSLSEYMVCHAARDTAAGHNTAALLQMYRANGLSAASEQSMSVRGNYFVTHVPSFAQCYRRLLGGAELEIGVRRWRLITGYGHCPEHISLYCEALGVLISGDMLLPRITTNVSVQAYEPEGNPLALFLDSTARMLSLPADTLVLPSHGLPFRGARERASQLAEHHRLRLAELEAACDSPRSAADLVPVLFRRELDGHQMFFAMGESMAHLHYLLAQGRLLRLPPQDGVLRYVRP